MKALRWGYVFSGSVVMLFAGLIYGWSVYRSAILSEFPGWTASQFSLNFSLCMTCFCIGTLLCGALAKKVPARLMMVVAAVLILVGFCMTSHMRTLGGLYLGYGVFAGFGIGIVYNAVMSVTLKWFPDCSGLVSGILLMGFGFSAMLMGPLFTKITQLSGWRMAFLVLGVATAVVSAADALIMRSPPEVEGSTSSGTGQLKSPSEISPRQMLRTSSFWAYFVWTTFLSGGGLAISAHSYAMAEETLLASAASVAYTELASKLSVLVALFSVFNGIGRMVFGAVFDRLKRRFTMNAICVCYLISTAVMFFALWRGLFPLLLLGLICCGFSYGGIMPTNSAYVRSAFGTRYYPINFSIVALNLLPASYLGPFISGALYDASQSYLGIIVCLLLFTVIGFICARAITIRCEEGYSRIQK